MGKRLSQLAIAEAADLTDGSRFLVMVTAGAGGTRGITAPELRIFAQQGLAAVATSGAWADVTGKPTLGTAAALDVGAINGVAALDGTGKVPASQLPASVLDGLRFKGTWNASTNSPDLSALTPEEGDFYKVNTAGTTELGGIAEWNAGDWAIFTDSAWQRIDGNSTEVVSVAGKTGEVVLEIADVTDLGEELQDLDDAITQIGDVVSNETGMTLTHAEEIVLEAPLTRVENLDVEDFYGDGLRAHVLKVYGSSVLGDLTQGVTTYDHQGMAIEAPYGGYPAYYGREAFSLSNDAYNVSVLDIGSYAHRAEHVVGGDLVLSLNVDGARFPQETQSVGHQVYFDASYGVPESSQSVRTTYDRILLYQGAPYFSEAQLQTHRLQLEDLGGGADQTFEIVANSTGGQCNLLQNGDVFLQVADGTLAAPRAGFNIGSHADINVDTDGVEDCVVRFSGGSGVGLVIDDPLDDAYDPILKLTTLNDESTFVEARSDFFSVVLTDGMTPFTALAINGTAPTATFSHGVGSWNVDPPTTQPAFTIFPNPASGIGSAFDQTEVQAAITALWDQIVQIEDFHYDHGHAVPAA